MSSSTPNSPTSVRRDTRPLPIRPTVVSGGRTPTDSHEFMASPTSILQEAPVIAPEGQAIHDEPQPLRQDSIHVAHLPLHQHSLVTPPVSPQVKPHLQGVDEPPSKEASQAVYDTVIQNLVQSQLVALGMVDGSGKPLGGQAPSQPMSVLRIRLWIAFCVGFVVLAPLVSVLLGLNLHAKDMRYVRLKGPEFEGRTIAFDVKLVAADPKHGILRMDWGITGEQNSACSAANQEACTPVNIYFDTNLLRPEGALPEDTLTSERPSRPLFVFNAKGFAAGDIRAQRPVFRTQLALFSEGKHPSSLLHYPFDKYTAELVFFAEEATTNNTVGVKIGRTEGVAVGFEAEVSHKTDREVPPGVVEALIVLTRSTLVKSYSVVATIAIWVVTIILALVMITSVFFGFKQRPEVLLIPVATLFAFTTLRQSMPGAPEGFGDIIDLVGLVPCLALLALTAALSLGVFLLSDPSATTRTIRWKNMHEAFPVLKRKRAGPKMV